jgi:DNA-binding Lrp family transcriptional regulator
MSMVRAILYVEVAEGSPSAADQLEHVSLANCLQLVSFLSPNEVIVRVECNDVTSLNEAITHSFAEISGVTRITTCVVINS